MHFRFKADTDHSKRFFNSPVIVHNIGLGDCLNDLAVQGNHHGSCGFNNTGKILFANLPVFPLLAGNRHNTTGIDPLNVVAAYSGPA
jgi:hypothetical protein